MSTTETSSDVLIIGGGMSGLSVAYHLILNDFSGRIIILESRPRIGGRIASTTTKYECHRIELGANWIHGIMGNPIHDMALKHKLIDQIPSAGKHIVEARSLTGNRVDIDIVEEVYRIYAFFVKKIESYFHLQDNDKPLRFDNSVGQHLKADIDSWINGLKNADNDSKDVIKAIFNTLVNRETCITGCHSMDEISLKDFGSYVELPGGNTTVPQGFSRVLNCLLDEMNERLVSKWKLGDKSHFNDGKQLSILKSHKVTKIKWKGLSQDDKNNVEVICENGSIFRSDHIVITLPLGVLKKNGINLFEPKLPDYKLEAIKALGFGVVDKIFLEYSLPLNNFIDVNIDETLVLWNADNPSKYKCFNKIYSISKITNHCLLLWASGEEALELEQLSDDEINEELTQLLQLFYNNKKLPKADNVIVTRWASDPFASGSYSYIPRNSSVRDIELLAQPIYSDPSHEKPVMVFAGEATHPSFYSTVHGAFLSGRKAAYYLLDTNVENDLKTNIKITSKM